MEVLECDSVVVGAGIEGSSTALYLTSQGRSVLLLEQFTLPHTRGSSGGESRLIRSAYSEDHFSRMMKEAFEMWTDIEKETNSKILLRSGVLCIAKPPYESFTEAEENLKKFNPDALESLTVEEAGSRYPLHKLTSEHQCFIDKTGGTIRAKIALQAVQKRFQEKGGRIISPIIIESMEFVGDEVLIFAENYEIKCKSVVFCCGPWTNKVLKKFNLGLDLPLQPERVNVFYYREKIPNQHTLANNFLPFLEFVNGPHSVYGFPSLEYPGCVKVCAHFGVPCDPDERDKVAGYTEDRKLVKDFIEELFPTLESDPAIVESCMYTVTPDESYILDRHPLRKNVIIGAGFSGTGFKLAPVVGKILGNLALNKPSQYKMDNFVIARFHEMEK